MRPPKGLKLLMLPLSLLGGWAFYVLLAVLESRLNSGLLFTALIEETAKLSLFFLVLIPINFLRVPRQEDVYIYPLLIVLGFGISENIAYFIRFPSDVVFIRLFYAYPIHINTALVYTLLFVQKKYLAALAVLVPTVLYHYGLNLLSLNSSKTILSLVGLANIVLLIYLFYRVVQIVSLRSFTYVRRKP